MAPVGADALDFSRLEEAEQHDLHARAHLAYFVEEDRSVRAPSRAGPACRDTRP
jgi:hypothetical protein